METRGAFLLVMELARLLGIDDIGSATDKDALMLRFLTPIAKLYTAKQVWKSTNVMCKRLVFSFKWKQRNMKNVRL